MKRQVCRGYLIRVGDDSYSLCIDEITSDEKWGDRPFSKNDGDVDIVESDVPPDNPASASL